MQTAAAEKAIAQADNPINFFMANLLKLQFKWHIAFAWGKLHSFEHSVVGSIDIKVCRS
ncbi:hypothetical protein [Chroococcidiopsis sp. SAG 2025]|uniref:hypothetical protein n=1 Tax=Chroococcidiopsis sp. SAG 2025 TaxID=171389 RepID=UPI00293714C8|nr:hypothetical protein [Chroococcidiopsis sp. SAG 2025]